MATISIFERKISPYHQLLFVLVLTLVMMGMSYFMPKVQYSSTEHIMPWVVVCGMILFFALLNSVLSFSASKDSNYWMQSMISFATLLIVSSLLAWLVSGVSIYEAGSVRWIFMVLTFGYLVFMSIVNLIKFLLDLSKKSDERFLNKHKNS